MKLTITKTCSIDCNGRLRLPSGRYATQKDAKHIHAERLRTQLSRWSDTRVIERRMK